MDGTEKTIQTLQANTTLVFSVTALAISTTALVISTTSLVFSDVTLVFSDVALVFSDATLVFSDGSAVNVTCSCGAVIAAEPRPLEGRGNMKELRAPTTCLEGIHV